MKVCTISSFLRYFNLDQIDIPTKPRRYQIKLKNKTDFKLNVFSLFITWPTLHDFSWSHSSSPWFIYFLLWYVYTIPTISLLLASTITTFNGPVVAFSVTPSLSPSAKHQITCIHTYHPYALTHAYSLFCLCYCSFFLLIVLSAQNACSHTHRCSCFLLYAWAVVPYAQPCFSTSSCPLVVTLCLSVHWQPVTRAPCLCPFLCLVSFSFLTVRWVFTHFSLHSLCLAFHFPLLFDILLRNSVYYFCLFYFHSWNSFTVYCCLSSSAPPPYHLPFCS